MAEIGPVWDNGSHHSPDIRSVHMKFGTNVALVGINPHKNWKDNQTNFERVFLLVCKMGVVCKMVSVHCSGRKEEKVQRAFVDRVPFWA